MATKFLNRYGTGLNEIDYDDTQYSPVNHTHNEYLPLSGGVMTGDIQFKTANQTTTPFKVRDSGSNYGHNIIIGGNGSTLIGAGESVTALPDADTNILKTEEVMYITSDTTVRIFTNCNTIANRKEVKINNSGHIEIPNAATAQWISAFKQGNAALSTTSTNYYATLNGKTKNGRWCLSSYPTSSDIVYLGYATDSHINSGDPNSMDRQFQFDMSNGNLEVPGDVRINGSSVKAVIDFMNKYSGMLNIIGNNA